MDPELKTRIESRETWTFPECLALASEFGLKTRFVVAMVMMLGRRYVDGEAGSFTAAGKTPSAGGTDT